MKLKLKSFNTPELKAKNLEHYVGNIEKKLN